MQYVPARRLSSFRAPRRSYARGATLHLHAIARTACRRPQNITVPYDVPSSMFSSDNASLRTSSNLSAMRFPFKRPNPAQCAPLPSVPLRMRGSVDHNANPRESNAARSRKLDGTAAHCGSSRYVERVCMATTAPRRVFIENIRVLVPGEVRAQRLDLLAARTR